MFRIMTLEEAAEDAFVKAEHLKALSMMSTPTDYEERKKAFVELTKARAAASEAESRLLAMSNGVQVSVKNRQCSYCGSAHSRCGSLEEANYCTRVSVTNGER